MAQDSRAGRQAIRIFAIALFVATAAVVLPGCLFGGDDDEVTTLTETVPPTVPKEAQKKKDKGGNKDQATGAAAGGACGGVSGAISGLKARGTSCNQAQAVAKLWLQRQSSCNTIDDPNSPEGYKRTCTVSGFKCTARRDTSSDRRSVRCTKGSARIRFTFS